MLYLFHQPALQLYKEINMSVLKQKQLFKARDFLLAGDILANVYLITELENKEKIKSLEVRLNE